MLLLGLIAVGGQIVLRTRIHSSKHVRTWPARSGKHSTAQRAQHALGTCVQVLAMSTLCPPPLACGRGAAGQCAAVDPQAGKAGVGEQEAGLAVARDAQQGLVLLARVGGSGRACLQVG